MTLCFLGLYDENYSRNQILFAGLRHAGVPIIEVHTQLIQLRLESSAHIGISATVRRLVRKLSFFPVLLANLGKISRSDVIVCAYPAHADLPIAWCVAKLFGKPLVFDPMFSLTDVFVNDFRILPASSLKRKLFQELERILFHLPDLVIADTHYQKENYVRLFGISPKRIAVVPLGVNSGLYQKSTAQKKGRLFRVVYYGLYNPIHGVEHIIDAAHLLAAEKDIEFLMIGDGQTYAQSVARAKRYGLKNMKFLKLKEKESMPYLQTADVFLGLFAPAESVFRTIANKVVQGMSMGIPVITGEGKAIKSAFVHKKHLYLVPMENPASLAGAIREIKTDAALRHRLQSEGYGIIMKSFTPKAVAQQFIEAIKSLIPIRPGLIKY